MNENISDVKREMGSDGKQVKLSRKRKPDGMSLEQWQVALRRRYGRKQNFTMKNLGDRPLFSEYAVTNLENSQTYRVAVRGWQLGVNYCSCTDFAVNTLGTCKHVEFVLSRLGDAEEKREKLGINIPTLCYHPMLKPYGACRICQVEVKTALGGPFRRQRTESKGKNTL